MNSTDTITRFLLPEYGIRGELVQIQDSLQTVLKQRPYPPAVEEQIAEMMVASALLAATIKFNGNLVVQARGNGAVSALQTECDNHYNLRAIARWQDPVPNTPDLTSLLGKGQLVVTILPLGGEPYQGIVPLVEPTLAPCIEHYFEQSEQLTTKLWLFVSEHKAAGLLIQKLPTESTDKEDGWEHIETLAKTVTADELINLPHAQLLHRLFHQENCQIFESQSLQFKCSCSKRRTAEALIALGKEELQQMIDDGNAKVNCDFCNQTYHFDKIDLRAMLEGQFQVLEQGSENKPH